MKELSKKLSLDALKDKAEIVLDKAELAVANGRNCYYALTCSDGNTYCANNDCNDPFWAQYWCEHLVGVGAYATGCCVGC